MKTDEWKEYWTKLASDAGLPPEKAQQIWDEALQNEKVLNGLVARSEYSRDLDSTRDKVAKETKEKTWQESKAYYDNWLAENVEPQRKQMLAILDDYNKYKSTYGDLDGSFNATGIDGKGNGNSLTKDEVEAMLQEKLSATTAAFVDMQKKSMRVATRHLHDFGEPLDPNELEKFAKDNGYSDIDIAYKEYVAPRIEAKRQEEFEAKLKAAREEGAKEERSRLSNPATHKSREYINPFLKPSEDASADKARAGFFEEWENYDNK